MTPNELGKIAYDTYWARKEVLEWQYLVSKTRDRWQDVAKAVLTAHDPYWNLDTRKPSYE